MSQAPPDRPASLLILIAASYGGIDALTTILRALPVTLPAAVAVVQHRPPDRISALAEILQRISALPISTATAGDSILTGHVYLASPDRHLIVTPLRHFEYVNGRRIRHVQSSANPLFETAAEVFGPRAIGVVLTGLDSDGTDGVQAIHAHGGIVVAQDPASAGAADMPRAAIQTGSVDYVAGLETIAPLLVRLAAGPADADRVTDNEPPPSRTAPIPRGS